MRQALVPIALVVLGVGVLAVAGHLWVDNDLDHYGQATYAIAGPEGSDIELQSSVPEEAAVIGYEELPPAAQAAFEARLAGEHPVLWEADDRRAARALFEHSGGYIRYQGAYYEYIVLVGHRGPAYWLRGLLEFGGAAVIGLGLVGFGGKRYLDLRAAR